VVYPEHCEPLLRAIDSSNFNYEVGEGRNKGSRTATPLAKWRKCNAKNRRALANVRKELAKLIANPLHTTATTPAEPASTCCFCSKPHHPQDCGEMRALLFAPATPTISDLVALAARVGETAQRAATDIPMGLWPLYNECETCGGEGRLPAYGYGDQAGGYAETCEDCKGKGVMPPLDVDFAPCGPEVA
jgi:hypothetical protein